MHITLRQLEVFAEVLKSGSTTQASQKLALSQSAVSAALTDLEGQLGVQFFDRVGKRLVVNEHGRLLYPRVVALLEQAGEIEQLFRNDNGAIRVYASSTIGNYILPEIIARYRRDFPDLPLELSVGNTQDVVNAIIDFRVDVGFIEGPCHMAEIVTEPWLDDELVVFAAPDNALAKARSASRRWPPRRGYCVSAGPAPGKSSTICCYRICRNSSSPWNWAIPRRLSTRCAMGWGSVACRAGSLPSNWRRVRWWRLHCRWRVRFVLFTGSITDKSTCRERYSALSAIASPNLPGRLAKRQGRLYL